MLRPHRNPLIAGVLLAAGLVCSAYSRPALAGSSCDKVALQRSVPQGTTIAGASLVTLPPPYEASAYCSINAVIATASNGRNNQVRFALGLPAAWNQNFLFIGNEGFGGAIEAVASGEFAVEISRGYATAATDAGHESQLKTASALDGSFGLAAGEPNVAARDDYASRAVHLTAVAAEALTEAYYDSAMFSFFDGCSTGGRQGLVEAQQFPTDFNGIVAGAPAIGDAIAGFNWNEESLLRSPKGYLTSAKLQFLDKEVLLACDGADGETDKLIQDPRQCNFDPSKLQCPYDRDSSDCLTTEQIAVVKDIYAGAKADGVQLYPGYMPSDPAGPDGWAQWITGTAKPAAGAEPWGQPPQSFTAAPIQWSLQDQFMKYLAFNSPDYDSRGFNLGETAAAAQLSGAVMHNGADGENPHLSAFFNAGGKLILYHGWSDPALSPLATVQYYNSIATQLHLSLGALQAYARLFMVPGMHHCGGGPGPNVFDPLTPLVSWVEDGAAPNSLLARHYANNDLTNKVTRTMPLCAYPSTALFTGGEGNRNDGEAWVCSQSAPVGSTSASYLHEALLKLD
jgi:feruloyl esterase